MEENDYQYFSSYKETLPNKFHHETPLPNYRFITSNIESIEKNSNLSYDDSLNQKHPKNNRITILKSRRKINLKGLRPSRQIFTRQMKPSVVISVIVLLSFLGFRFYMQSKDPSIAEIPYFGLYLNMNTRWFYPVSIVLQEIYIKLVVQDNFSEAFDRKHPHMTVWVTAFFFFIIHFQYPLYYMTGAMVLCMITGYLFEKYPSIWGPVLIHFVIGFLPRCLGILQIIER